jgi:hypothetical protein
MEKALESIRKWLKQSGLQINDQKNDICIFTNITLKMVIILGNQKMLFVYWAYYLIPKFVGLFISVTQSYNQTMH